MKLYDSGGNGLFQDIDFLCNVTTAEFSVADRTRSINRYYHRCVAEILDSMDEWDFQGVQAWSNLVANQQAYPWPTDILTIKRVEVDYDGDSVYTPADPFDAGSYDGTIANSAEINKIFSEGDPKYDAWANSAFLYPVPDTAVNSGLVIWYENNVTDLTATTGGLTASPVLVEPFHRILSLGASLDYGIKYRMEDLVAFCKSELFGKEGLLTKMRKFYGTRAADKILSFKSFYYGESYD